MKEDDYIVRIYKSGKIIMGKYISGDPGYIRPLEYYGLEGGVEIGVVYTMGGSGKYEMTHRLAKQSEIDCFLEHGCVDVKLMRDESINKILKEWKN